MSHNEYVGPDIAEKLRKSLPQSVPDSDWHVLPDGTHALIGTERVWAGKVEKPKPCAIDLGGDVPFVLWKDSAK
jgi:hypothetical protein